VPIPIADADIKAIAAYLHGLQAQGTNQGGPPPGPPVELDIVVGDAKAGEKYFAAKCSTCHSATGDLQGLATRLPEPRMLQNLWVSGGRVAGPRRGGRRPLSEASVPTATVTLPSGEKVEGRLVRLDDFLVAVEVPDGTQRTIRRDGDVPTVEVKNPLDGHRDLLSLLTDTNMHDVTAYLTTLK
jgi:cytochrome c oxidase cbb3-type subunit 3